jgi:PD-(D/E)XK nuclease superfamily
MNITSKIKNAGGQMTESQYRSVELPSYSSLKVYAEAPMRFFKMYVSKEIKPEEPSRDMVLGSIVHNLLARNDEQVDEDKFLIGDVSEIDKDANHPSYFAWKIWELTEADVLAHGDQTRTFASIAEEAFQQTKYDPRTGEEVRFKKKELEYALGKFEGTPLETWYQMKRKAYGRSLVSIEDMDNCLRIYKDVREYKDTSAIYCQETDERYEVFNETPMMFQHDGLTIKMMPDKVMIDHQQKVIQPYDTKVTWEENFSRVYLDKWYYLQGATYDTGIGEWQKEHDLVGYKRMPMKFVRVHNLSWYRPLICPMTTNDLKAAMGGFKTRWGKTYPGFRQLVQDLQWSLEEGIWAVRREDYLNNSVRMLNIPYGA